MLQNGVRTWALFFYAKEEKYDTLKKNTSKHEVMIYHDKNWRKTDPENRTSRLCFVSRFIKAFGIKCNLTSAFLFPSLVCFSGSLEQCRRETRSSRLLSHMVWALQNDQAFLSCKYEPASAFVSCLGLVVTTRGKRF